MATGGVPAVSEALRMVPEKITALMRLASCQAARIWLPPKSLLCIVNA